MLFSFPSYFRFRNGNRGMPQKGLPHPTEVHCAVGLCLQVKSSRGLDEKISQISKNPNSKQFYKKTSGPICHKKGIGYCAAALFLHQKSPPHSPILTLTNPSSNQNIHHINLTLPAHAMNVPKCACSLKFKFLHEK